MDFAPRGPGPKNMFSVRSHLGGIWEHLEPFGAHLEAIWVHLGVFWAPLGAFLAPWGFFSTRALWILCSDEERC